MTFGNLETIAQVPENTAHRLARHVVNSSPPELGSVARQTAARCLLDALGSAAAALDMPGVRAARTAAMRLFGGGRVPIWFTNERVSPGAALMANSAATAALDLDDGYRQARGHPGAAVVPAALAVLNEDACVSTDELVASIVVGYEVALRVAMARPAYSPSGAWSGFGVVAALGRLRGASQSQIANALAIVAQTSPALPALAGLAGSDVKEGIPYGCAAGLVALESAMAGVTGPTVIFDDASLFDARVIADGLGDTALIDGSYFKPFGCCRHIHGALDALLALRQEHDFVASDIDSIEVNTYRATFNLSNLPAPGSLVEAQYSVPFCAALVTLHGADALLPMHDAQLQDTRVLQLARRVTVALDPAIEPLFPQRSPARVAVRLRNGVVLASPLVDPRGDPSCPLSWDDLVRKFRQVSARTLGARRQAAVLAALEQFEQGHVAPLCRALQLLEAA